MKIPNFADLMLKDTSGKKSVTFTVFVIGTIIIHAKLLLAGITIGRMTVVPFSGIEYSAALTALGGIYVLRRSTDPTTKGQNQSPISSPLVPPPPPIDNGKSLE